MRIEIVNVIPPKTEQRGNSSYQVLEVAYKDEQGRVSGKKIMSFADPAVFETLSKSNRGESYDIKAVKEGKFWNWKDASKSDGSVSPTAAKSPSTGFTPTTGRVTGSNYATQAEREWQQTRIGRQACLNSAIALAVSNGSKLKLEAIVADAEKLEAWVNRRDAKKEAVAAIEAMADDIPI